MRLLLPSRGALLLIALALCPAVSAAGPLTLSIGNGRVSISAQDVPLRQVLAEWERQGGTKIVNRDRVPASLLTIELTNVREEKALETILRTAAGFVAVARGADSTGASMYARIVIMPGSATPMMTATGGGASASGQGMQPGGPGGRPVVQRRVLADGRVINFVDNPNRPGEMTIVDDEDPQESAAMQALRPPFGAPGRVANQPPGGDPDQNDGQQPAPAPTATPMVPTRTLPAPGILPALKTGPGPAGAPPVPPGPIKPPQV